MTELPEAMVERATRALHANDKTIPPWDQLRDDDRDIYRSDTRAALEAAGVGELLEAARFLARVKGAGVQVIGVPEGIRQRAGAALSRAEGRHD